MRSICAIVGSITAIGLRLVDWQGQIIYNILTRWYPGYMSAPHWYETDRLCVVVSGTWWVASGETFDPENTVPVQAGGFVRRVAHTPHYDGCKKTDKEPAVIAICGVGPIKFHKVDEAGPSWIAL